MKTYKNWIVVAVVATLVLGSSSCRKDFLDRPPLSKVTPQYFFNSSENLEAYSIALYDNVFRTHVGAYGMGEAAWDNDTDNQIGATSPSTARFTRDQQETKQAGSIGFGTIRSCNVFIQNVEANLKAGVYTQSEVAENALGEVYVVRAMDYYNKLVAYGDFPIVTDIVSDNNDEILKRAVRRPSNEVARQILKDLDRAFELLSPSNTDKNRITRNAVLLLKARVALFEGTFLKYHKGTPRVPGQPGWPGFKIHKDFTLNVDEEVNFFLDQAMQASKQVADATTLTPNNKQYEPTKDNLGSWNPYYEMFATQDPSKFSEVLLWRAYSVEKRVSHRMGHYMRSGGATGYTKSLVESFLMEDGRPHYAASASKPYQGDALIKNVKVNRDGRLRLFLFDEDSKLLYKGNNDFETFRQNNGPRIFGVEDRYKDVTGYRPRKFFSYDQTVDPVSENNSTSASIVLRSAEAYLIYLEASYERNHSLNADAIRYWHELRNRAGVADYDPANDATDMEQEKEDWGAYSGGQLLTDKILFNIRRERRNELIAEGRRWEDLLRWRSLDQVKNYVVKGFNYWDEQYKFYNTLMQKKSKKDVPVSQGGVWATDGTMTLGTTLTEGLVSSKALSKYLLPLQIALNKNNSFLSGYSTHKGVYQAPFPIRQLELASPDERVETSRMYQTAYWSDKPNMPAEQF